MTHDWMLVETLGSEPVVVAHGAHTKDLVPIGTFLRRNPPLMALQTAIATAVARPAATTGRSRNPGNCSPT